MHIRAGSRRMRGTRRKRGGWRLDLARRALDRSKDAAIMNEPDVELAVALDIEVPRQFALDPRQALRKDRYAARRRARRETEERIDQLGADAALLLRCVRTLRIEDPHQHAIFRSELTEAEASAVADHRAQRLSLLDGDHDEMRR